MSDNKIIKKRHPKFNVMKGGGTNRSKIKDRWRRHRGIDSKKRIKRKGYGAVPGIGYRNKEEVRYTRPDGKKEILINNEKDLLGMKGMDGYVGRFHHALSKRKRIILQKIADENKIKIVNKVIQ